MKDIQDDFQAQIIEMTKEAFHLQSVKDPEAYDKYENICQQIIDQKEEKEIQKNISLLIFAIEHMGEITVAENNIKRAIALKKSQAHFLQNFCSKDTEKNANKMNLTDLITELREALLVPDDIHDFDPHKIIEDYIENKKRSKMKQKKKI